MDLMITIILLVLMSIVLGIGLAYNPTKKMDKAVKKIPKGLVKAEEASISVNETMKLKIDGKVIEPRNPHVTVSAECMSNRNESLEKEPKSLILDLLVNNIYSDTNTEIVRDRLDQVLESYKIALDDTLFMEETCDLNDIEQLEVLLALTILKQEDKLSKSKLLELRDYLA